jgi:hypothetical protein
MLAFLRQEAFRPLHKSQIWTQDRLGTVTQAWKSTVFWGAQIFKTRSLRFCIPLWPLKLVCMISPAHTAYCTRRTTSVFTDEPRRMLIIIQRFGKHCSCHLHGEYVMAGRFWKPYFRQAVVRQVLPTLYKASKNAQTSHIHPEDGSCKVCRNVG